MGCSGCGRNKKKTNKKRILNKNVGMVLPPYTSYPLIEKKRD